MIYPSMTSLLEKVDSRYTLVIAASRRARMLTEGARRLTTFETNKDVTVAIHEISEGKVTYHRIGKNGLEEAGFGTAGVAVHRPEWESKRLQDEDDSEWSHDELLDADDEFSESDDE